jgi:hypothetical protein
MLTRRGFLGTLAAAAAGMALDPERLLWAPGQKTIFLPTPVLASGNTFITPEWITRETMAFLRNALKVQKTIDREFFSGLQVRIPQRFVTV